MNDVTKIFKGIEQRILADIKNGTRTFTPEQVDSYSILLCTWYEKYSEELAEIEISMPAEWLKLKQDCKTNREADLRYDMSDNGKRRIKLKYTLKATEKLISALRDRLRRLNNESFSQY